MTTRLTDELKSACATCSIRELCLPGGLQGDDIERLNHMVSHRRRVRKAVAVFRPGDRFEALFAVRTGCFKTTVRAHTGHEQVTGFFMPGDILGLDGVATDEHTVDACALEDGELCVIPYADLERIACAVPALQHQLRRVMGREIVREQRVLALLGNLDAETRVAAFLLNLSERFRQLGFAADAFVLRMTRRDIGSYLGLSLETVSRSFSQLGSRGIIASDRKHVRITDRASLRRLVRGGTEQHARN
ncbi:MAG: helix-turn-helix domain-containing protein [Pseudomonadota bacterium]